MKLSIIIPAYNEAARLPKTLAEMLVWLHSHCDDAFEIIVVDDGSTDSTIESIAEFVQDPDNQLRICKQVPNQGKGAAVRRGMLEASGEVRLFLDADHSTHIREWLKTKPALERADIVIASRQHPDSIIPVHQSWLRERMGKTFNYLMRMCIQLHMQDTQCGFKAFSAQAAQYIFTHQRVHGFSFDVEALYLAQRSHFKITEIPVEWHNEDDSKVRILIDPILMFIDIIRMRWLHRHTPKASPRKGV